MREWSIGASRPNRDATRRFAALSCRNLERIDRLRFDIGGGLMARIWNTPVFILATVYFVVDVVSSYVTQPITLMALQRKGFSSECDSGSFL